MTLRLLVEYQEGAGSYFLDYALRQHGQHDLMVTDDIITLAASGSRTIHHVLRRAVLVDHVEISRGKSRNLVPEVTGQVQRLEEHFW